MVVVKMVTLAGWCGTGLSLWWWWMWCAPRRPSPPPYHMITAPSPITLHPRNVPSPYQICSIAATRPPSLPSNVPSVFKPSPVSIFTIFISLSLHFLFLPYPCPSSPFPPSLT
ncbi:hypothetical protein E2C01_062595 [Portunus trituberculatus]|uniref:Uncharacterized protein n=1 Tax=Portunus trituberculatus TaxID=210409 RepID=A0A5B7HFQ6_PORTR|nr:hypothetical protein [Portunus trituberculatus]